MIQWAGHDEFHARSYNSCLDAGVGGHGPANQPPHAVANAGQDIQTGQVFSQVTVYIGPTETGTVVSVTASGSTDPDNDALTYLWACRGANDEKCVFLSVPLNQVNFRPVLPEGRWNITLTVDEGTGTRRPIR